MRSKSGQVVWNFTLHKKISREQLIRKIKSLVPKLRASGFKSKHAIPPVTGNPELELIQWFYSRKSLLNCFLRSSSSNPFQSYSISHTKTGSAACLIYSNKKTTQSVGIDVEQLSRRINPSVIRRVAHPKDNLELNLTPHQSWTLKEAAFKANPRNKKTVLANYQIVNKIKNKVILKCGKRDFECQLFIRHRHQIAICTPSKNKV